jgi:hypothetical protein
VTVWLLTFNFIHFMAAFWVVFTFGGSGSALTAHGSLDLKQEIQIQIQTLIFVRYESTITGQFFGHTHFDHFEVFYDLATLKRPTNVAYISPSVTPFSNLNMGYRIFTVDGNYTGSSRVCLPLYFLEGSG